ncbi:hypothetical protein BC835DRAFT_378813 [Cytidiella melzeri]|nr:hypothetical protein BC835DRAFT_378813 [Cytidiella melzeri]
MDAQKMGPTQLPSYQEASIIVIFAYMLVLVSENIVGGLTAFKVIQHPLYLPYNGLLFHVYILLIFLRNVLVRILGPVHLPPSERLL